VIDLTISLQRHLAASPIFMPMIRYRSVDYMRNWLAGAATPIFVAYIDGRAAGHLKMGPVSANDASLPHAGEKTIAVSGVFAWEDLRSRGIGRALLDHGLAWARGEGYTSCAVDFESANIIGMDFWRRSGFRAVDYAVGRHIDERIAWADEHRDRDEFLATG
jgi:GNAT superfamily N-acetyltransferase